MGPVRCSCDRDKILSIFAHNHVCFTPTYLNMILYASDPGGHVLGQPVNGEEEGFTFRHYSTVHVLDLGRVWEGWRAVATHGALPARRGHSTCLWEREEEGRLRRSLLVFGGVGDDAQLRDDTWELALETHVWSKWEHDTVLGDAPIRSRGHMAVIVEDHMIVVGGQVSGPMAQGGTRLQFSDRPCHLHQHISFTLMVLTPLCACPSGWSTRRTCCC